MKVVDKKKIKRTCQIEMGSGTAIRDAAISANPKIKTNIKTCQKKNFRFLLKKLSSFILPPGFSIY